jgi:hypothetical protein
MPSVSLANLFSAIRDELAVHTHAVCSLFPHPFMPSTIITLIVLTLAVVGGFYQIYVHPVVRLFGVFEPSEVPNIGMKDCLKVEELSTCESEYL